DVIPLHPERPVRRQQIFEAGADVGTVEVAVVGGEYVTTRFGQGEALVDPAPSGLAVKEQVRRGEETESAGQRCEPTRPAVERLVRLDRADVTAAEAGGVEETLHADHPIGRELIIAAELSAASESTGRVPAVIESCLEVSDARLGASPA